MKTAEALRGEKLELLERADALTQLIDDGAELSAEQQSEFDALTAANGEIAKKAAEVEKAEAYESKRDAIRRQRLADQNQTHKFGTSGPHKDRDEEHKPNIVLKGQRSKAFQDPRDAYLSGCWLQAAVGIGDTSHARNEMNRFGWGEYATMTENVGNKGGIFIPAPMVNEIIRNRDLVGVAPQLARTISLGGETLTLFEETSQQTVYYPGEGGAITASDATFESHTLTVKKRAAMTKISPELLADAPFSAADLVVNSMAYKFAYQLDNEFINGDGTATYGGEEGLIDKLLSGQTKTADSGENVYNLLDLPDWDATIAELPGLYLAGSPAWLMSRSVWAGSCLTLSATAGGAPVRDVQNGLSGFTWRGYPVIFSDLMPAEGASKIAAFFGDFSRGITIGDRGDMAIATSVDSDFANDLIAIRMTHRYDILVHDSSCYAALKLAS